MSVRLVIKTQKWTEVLNDKGRDQGDSCRCCGEEEIGKLDIKEDVLELKVGWYEIRNGGEKIYFSCKIKPRISLTKTRQN